MDKVIFPYGLIYGPHPSRRLGLSLGVDLTPMACTFSCLYCERGRTLLKCRDHREFAQIVDIESFLDSLKRQIKNVKIDCLTFAGTGEPTLELKLGEFISSARKIIGQIPIKVITNSSLLTYSIVRKNLAEADEVIAKLNAASNDTFIEIHRPFNKSLEVEEIINGLHTLKREIKKITIEILFIKSYQNIKTNSTDKEVIKLTEVINELEPNTVQIHTVSRMPAEPYILPVNRRFIETTTTYMKNKLFKTNILSYF